MQKQGMNDDDDDDGGHHTPSSQKKQGGVTTEDGFSKISEESRTWVKKVELPIFEGIDLIGLGCKNREKILGATNSSGRETTARFRWHGGASGSLVPFLALEQPRFVMGIFHYGFDSKVWGENRG